MLHQKIQAFQEPADFLLEFVTLDLSVERIPESATALGALIAQPEQMSRFFVLIHEQASVRGNDWAYRIQVGLQLAIDEVKNRTMARIAELDDAISGHWSTANTISTAALSTSGISAMYAFFEGYSGVVVSGPLLASFTSLLFIIFASARITKLKNERRQLRTFERNLVHLTKRIDFAIEGFRAR